MSSNPAAPEPTEIAGRYRIVQKLGAGAFGTVYKAKDARLDRMVAIKTIRLEGLAASQAGLKEMLDRFDREARTAAGLKHPGIVTIHDFGEAEGLSYIVMELVDGVGLDRVIAKTGKMSVERAAAIGAQVAEALGYAHKHGVVHRDVKPANIMLEAGDRVKVADFGIAKPEDSSENLTTTGSLLGTPSYMSPEQARAHKLDGRSDLFSLGCILYEMLTGQKAFRGDSVTAIIFKIIAEEPPPLRELDPTVSDAMLQIVAKALAKAPEKRYQTGLEMSEALLAITRPGFVPTVRAEELPTSPAVVPTVVSAPTARPVPTISTAPTTARPAGPPPLPAAGGGPPTLPPTVVTPPTARSATPPPLAKPAARAPQPLVSAPPARRKGAAAGLLVGLGLAAVLGLAVIAAAGWYFFGRAGRTTETPGVPDTARVAATPAPPEAAPSAPPVETTTAGSTPAPAATAPAPAHGPTTTAASAHAGTVPRPQPPPTTPSAPPSTATEPVPPATGAGDYAYLDELPPETPDGRAAGEALAQKYRSGGSSSYSSSHFRARPRFPGGTTPAERPAVGTLLHLHQAEEAYHRKNGRYANPRELAEAGFLRLDVPVGAEGFRRARYGFRVTAGADSYRADAVPLAANGRAFMVDDSGFVRFPD